jgi:hypothetical protein
MHIKRMTMKNGAMIKAAVLALTFGLGLMAAPKTYAAGGKTMTIKGEVVDLACYLDHGARGEKHQTCAAKCISSGLPVGLLSGHQLYLVIGEHQPMNDVLAKKAAQVITLRGKVVERNGMKMIENAEIVPD